MQTSDHKGTLLPLLPLFLQLPSPSERQVCNLIDKAFPALYLPSVDCILAVCLEMPTILGDQLFSLGWINSVLCFKVGLEKTRKELGIFERCEQTVTST